MWTLTPTPTPTLTPTPTPTPTPGVVHKLFWTSSRRAKKDIVSAIIFYYMYIEIIFIIFTTCILKLSLFSTTYILKLSLLLKWGWSGGAMVLGKLPVPGRPTIWIQ